MESNKDEAARCVRIVESALASGDKQRALKFIRIARRLDHTLRLDDFLEACEKLDSPKPSVREEEVAVDRDRDQPSSSSVANGEQSYTEEHVRLIRQIKKTKDYYAVLGVEKGCSVEEIKKAYRRLSLKVHPDKNKAPGAEEAFKSVCKAFQCLSDEQLRRNYDQTGGVEAYELNQQHGNMRRRRRTTTMNDYFDEEFDPDEIFRSFFFGTQNDVFRAQRAFRTRGTGRQHRDHNVHGGGHRAGGGTGGTFNFIALLQILPIFLFLLFAYFPFSEPQYSLQKTYTYQIPKVTEKHGVEYFVKSEDFEQQFPQGSPARDNLEYYVLRDYKSVLNRYCHMELQRRQWVRNYPTPNCDKLRSLGVA